jgi:hypothetical protein
MARQLTMERPAMPVGPVHHGRYAKSSDRIFAGYHIIQRYRRLFSQLSHHLYPLYIARTREIVEPLVTL